LDEELPTVGDRGSSSASSRASGGPVPLTTEAMLGDAFQKGAAEGGGTLWEEEAEGEDTCGVAADADEDEETDPLERFVDLYMAALADLEVGVSGGRPKAEEAMAYPGVSEYMTYLLQVARKGARSEAAADAFRDFSHAVRSAE
jgi:hypothetical protein